MPGFGENGSTRQAAEAAAAAGDYATAEVLLRRVAADQEGRLGPAHLDLADTLNNLGVVCDVVGKPAEAERFYRRALAIATQNLGQDHPSVVTSRKNLADLLVAQGRAEDAAVLQQWFSMRKAPRGSQFDPVLPERSGTAGTRPQPASPGAAPRRLPLVALAAGGVLVVAVLVFGLWPRGDAPPSPPGADAAGLLPGGPVQTLAASPQPEATTALEPEHGRPATSAGLAAPPAATEPRRVPPRPAARSTSRSEAAAPSPVVVDAWLCRELTTAGPDNPGRPWECEEAGSEVGPGPMFFYTRLRSATSTTVEHRWLRENRVRQSVALRVRASPGDGYRTYSRRTLGEVESGRWRVEVRSDDGTVLDAREFVVR
jgi:hypothetical protein